MITAEDVVNAATDAMGGPFGWEGASDCSVTACDAFLSLTGIDFGAGLRGTYSTRAEALALIRARGGFLAMWRAQAVRCGLVPGAEQSGSIGVVSADGVTFRTLGLCVRPGLWAAKSQSGLSFCPANVEQFWNA
ncbi:DUF6950 family protein [Puniceibacterium confluentis]|uniref:DUF6950 family protein n=1 Tax=Puniceibacterium confluentis TaxID=1958944 RepID=UPI0035667CB2